MKRLIRLTESDIHKIVKESVNRIINEIEKFDKNGFSLETGFHKDTGTNRDPEGFNKLGLDKQGFKRDGYGLAGWNREGFNKKGFDKEGFDKEGFNKKGFDREGFNKTGFNKAGFDREGFDKNGLKKGSKTWDSIIEEYFENNKNRILDVFEKMSKSSKNDFGVFNEWALKMKVVNFLNNQIMKEVVKDTSNIDLMKKISKTLKPRITKFLQNQYEKYLDDLAYLSGYYDE